MTSSLRRMGPAILLLLLAPEACFAQTLSSWVGLFNILVGLILTAAFLFYGGGLIVWVVRLNTWPTNRDFAIELMEWAVTMLFALIILLAIVHYTQNNTRVILIVIAVVLVFFVARTIARSGGSTDGEHEGR